MIAQNPEGASLREYGCVVIDRTILKAKDQTARHPVTLWDLGHFTICKALAIKGAECKKAVHQAFHVAHVDLITSQRDCLECAGQQDCQHAKPELSYSTCHRICTPKLPFNVA